MSAAALSTTDPSGRQRTNTLRRSCEACRAVKAKCITEGKDATGRPQSCKRCMNHNINCVFENALARPKKIRYSARTRVKDVEEKLDGLIALISARNEIAGGQVALAPAHLAKAAAPVEISSSSEQSSPDALPTPAEPFSLESVAVPPAASAELYPSTSSALNDVIGRGLISKETAKSILTAYVASTGQQCPFVLLSPASNLLLMRRERPFLLLAILVVGSDVHLQERLALEFRKTLAQAMIVEAKNSLDLLQGLLVFCTWHHRYFTPFRSQLYQLSQIAVTMAVELNLGNRLAHFFSDFALFAQPSPFSLTNRLPVTKEFQDNIEEARTFIGAYCMSASIALAHRKPTHFKFDRNVGQIAQVLSSIRAAPSDVLLMHHVRVRKLTEDVGRAFSLHDPHADLMLDATYVDVMVKDFERQYALIRDSAPEEVWNNSALRCAMTFLPVAIYQVGMRIPSTHRGVLMGTIASPCCNWCESSIRLSLIMKCIHAAQTYINTFLAVPNATFRDSTIVEVGHHIDAVLLLARACNGTDMRHFTDKPEGDRVNFVGAANMDHYFQASERKVAGLLTEESDDRDVFFKLREVFRFGIMWHHKAIEAQQTNPDKIMLLNEKVDQKLCVPSLFLLDEVTNLMHSKCPYSFAKGCANAEDMDAIMDDLNACEQIAQAEIYGGSTSAPVSAPAPVPVPAPAPASTVPVAGAFMPTTTAGIASVGAMGAMESMPTPLSDEDFNTLPQVSLDETQPWTSDMDPWANMLQPSLASPWFGM